MSTQRHLQLVLDHEGHRQAVRVFADDVDVMPLPRPLQALQDQHDRLACVEIGSYLVS